MKEPTQVLIGENLVIAAVGQASATLLFQGGDAIPLAPGIDLQAHAMCFLWQPAEWLKLLIYIYIFIYIKQESWFILILGGI